jgi:hypothetical protein
MSPITNSTQAICDGGHTGYAERASDERENERRRRNKS